MTRTINTNALFRCDWSIQNPQNARFLSSFLPLLFSGTLHPTEDLSDPDKGRTSTTAVDPVKVLLTFEETSKWPDDLIAIRHVKKALLCAVGQLVNRNGGGRSWLNNNGVSLNVVWESQLFVLDVHCPRELVLLEMAAR
jgi:hypothetical protein